MEIFIHCRDCRTGLMKEEADIVISDQQWEIIFHLTCNQCGNKKLYKLERIQGVNMPCQICDSPIDFDEDFCYYCDSKYAGEPFDLWDHAMVDNEWEEM